MVVGPGSRQASVRETIKVELPRKEGMIRIEVRGRGGEGAGSFRGEGGYQGFVRRVGSAKCPARWLAALLGVSVIITTEASVAV